VINQHLLIFDYLGEEEDKIYASNIYTGRMVSMSKKKELSSHRSSSLVSFLKYGVAIAIGIVIGRLQNNLNETLSTPAATHGIFYDNDDGNVSNNKDKEQNDNITNGAFHPIHVYRGSPKAIHRLPDQVSDLTIKYHRGSQVDQDRVIEALVKVYRSKHSNEVGSDTTPNYFIDLAANDAIQLSNTLRLEKSGWEGLCVEPNPVYWYRLAHRKCKVAGAFVGGKSDMQDITVSLSKEYGGIVGDGFDNAKRKHTDEKRYSVSLSTVFSTFDVPRNIQYLSLDVEGAEELIMKDFPFDEYKINFITIERPQPGLQKLLKSHGYMFVTLLVTWGETLWVHRKVIENGFLMKDILMTARENSKWIDQKPKSGGMIFDLASGKYERKQK